MRSLQELKNRLSSYDGVDFVYYPNIGYIAWHQSTGDNIEVLFIEVKPGYGGWIYNRMVKTLLGAGREPYHSVFCFWLKSNQAAAMFYKSMEWNQVDLGQSIYQNDETVLCWITWKNLLQNLNVRERTNEGD